MGKQESLSSPVGGSVVFSGDGIQTFFQIYLLHGSHNAGEQKPLFVSVVFTYDIHSVLEFEGKV